LIQERATATTEGKPMTVHRRKFLQIGLGAGATPLLMQLPAAGAQSPRLERGAVEALTVRARALGGADVRVTAGPLAHAQQLNAAYLLELEPDRMLAYFRQRAGLTPKAEGYGGWDGDGRNLTGHIAGHWLSGVSLMYAATGDVRFRKLADYMVGELKEVQDAHGDGYLCALEGGRRCFAELARGEIRSAAFDLNGEWAPWYTLHKLYAGLRDAYRHIGNRAALEVEISFAAWAEGVLAGLEDKQIQHMLNTEFGGMNEVLVDLHVDTDDTRWLDLSRKFEHRKFIEPLQRHQDNLAGVHGNTQIPKLVGSADRYAATGDPGDLLAAAFFWDRVVRHHSFSSGGHGKDEYFGPPDQLGARVDGRTAETCNVYNMLRLTRRLFELRPDAAYADFHERALYNHILASIDPDSGDTCYMVPVGRGVQREYQDMRSSFTCCVGSGMESHALHGDGLYYHEEDRLWVNVFAPSTAEWTGAGLGVETQTDFPLGESATIRLTLATPRQLTVAVRRPYWVGDGFAVTVNGVPEIRRGRRNPDEEGEQAPPVSVPVIVGRERPVADWLKPVGGSPGHFRLQGAGREPDATDRERSVDLMPMYVLQRRLYTTYWDIFTADEWEEERVDYAAEAERMRLLEAATVAYLEPGETIFDRPFNLQAPEDSVPARLDGRPGRRGDSWFSYDVPVEPDRPMAMILTFHSDDRRGSPGTFEVQVDGTTVATQHVGREEPPRFYDVELAIPDALTRGKEKVTVRFEAKPDDRIATVFGLRMIRADAER